MNENQNQSTQINDVPLEELRARYLGKRPPASQTVYVQEPTASGTVITVQKPAGEAAKRTVAHLGRDLVLLATVLLICTVTLFSFATPTVQLGGETEYGETVSLFDFLWMDKEDSMIARLGAAMENLEALDSDGVGEGISSVLEIVRVFFLLIPAAIVGIKSVYHLIRAVCLFFQKNSLKLASVAVGSVAQSLIVYIFFAFFGSVSGGVGESAYYVGYSVSTGLSIAVAVGALLLIAATVGTFFIERHAGRVTHLDHDWIRAMASGAGYLLIGVVLANMRIYSVFVYVFSSSLSTALMSLIAGFSFESLIFPLLNLLIFVTCMTVNGRAVKGFTGAFDSLLRCGRWDFVEPNEAARMRRGATLSPLPVVILSLLSAIAILVLKDPAYGYGWAVDIHWQTVLIFMISAAMQTVLFAFREKKQRTTVPEERSAPEEQSAPEGQETESDS